MDELTPFDENTDYGRVPRERLVRSTIRQPIPERAPQAGIELEIAMHEASTKELGSAMLGPFVTAFFSKREMKMTRTTIQQTVCLGIDDVARPPHGVRA